MLLDTRCMGASHLIDQRMQNLYTQLRKKTLSVWITWIETLLTLGKGHTKSLGKHNLMHGIRPLVMVDLADGHGASSGMDETKQQNNEPLALALQMRMKILFSKTIDPLLLGILDLHFLIRLEKYLFIMTRSTEGLSVITVPLEVRLSRFGGLKLTIISKWWFSKIPES